MYKIFDTLEQYNKFTNDGTNLTSGVTYYVKEDGSSHFQTNNIDGEIKKYDMMDNEDLIDLIERDFNSINIPKGTTKIRNYFLYENSSLINITIPDSVTSIGQSAFYNCTGLTSIEIPSGVISIGSTAFNKCYNLTNITIPDSVTSIGQGAFQNCTSLTSIIIPDSVTEMGKAAFNKCNNLKNVILGNGITNIGEGCFSGCSNLIEINIPQGVTSIVSKAFQNCSSLTSVTIQATTPPTLGNTDAFNNTNNCPIYVPAASVSAYKAATNWSSYASRIQAIPA